MLPLIIQGFCGPIIHKALIEMPMITSSFIAAENVLWALSTMLSAALWGRIKKRSMRNYVKIEIIETLLLIILYALFILSWNPLLFYIIDVAFGVVVTTFFGQYEL